MSIINTPKELDAAVFHHTVVYIEDKTMLLCYLHYVAKSDVSIAVDGDIISTSNCSLDSFQDLIHLNFLATGKQKQVSQKYVTS